MVFFMLTVIANPKKDKRLHLFNTKIEYYNEAAKNNQLADALLLLQEIYYFQQHLTTLALNSLFDPSTDKWLRGIFDWTGIRQELTQWLEPDQLPISTLSTEMAFNTLTGISDVTQTMQLWREQIQPTWYDTVSFLWGSTRNQEIDQYIQDLLNLHDEYGFNSLNYYYGLQKIKTQVLHTINFSTLSSAELIPYQTLLKQINGQINAIILEIPVLRTRYMQHQSIALGLREDIDHATPDQKERISFLFSANDFNQPIDPELADKMTKEDISDYSEQMRKHKEEIHGILPNLEALYIRKISSANNKTWVLQYEEIGERTVLRVEQPSPAILIQTLRTSPVNEFLAQNYVTCVSEYNPYPIIISEYSQDGDLRSNRKDSKKFKKEGPVLQQAVNDIGQMASFCELLLEQGAMFADIKLSNFLLSSQNHIFINDMKAFKSVDAEGNILARDTIVTPPFAPPEYQKSLTKHHMHEGKPITLNADKFMSYQLGLALYDHLVLPSDPEWSTKKPLDFSHPIFESPQGKKLKTLIKLLTIENPETRKGISYAIQQLQALQKPSAKLHMALEVEKQIPGSGEVSTEEEIHIPTNDIISPLKTSDIEQQPSSPVPGTKNHRIK